jgi:hypothetical protein
MAVPRRYKLTSYYAATVATMLLVLEVAKWFS